MTHYYYDVLDTPCGPLLGAVDEGGAVVGVEFCRGREPHAVCAGLGLGRGACSTSRERTRELMAQLEAYFEGVLTAFALPLVPAGSPFQRQVWRALERIPYGATRTYGEVARTLGRPAAARAVGGAIGRNPISVVVPCHRVIGSDGSLTGFGGGLHVKSWLLAHEAQRVRD